VARVAGPGDLLTGPKTHGKVGDYKIWNKHVSFVVEGPGLQSGYHRFGGNVVDADVTRASGEPGRSQMGEVFFAFGHRLFEAREVEVVDASAQDPRARVVVKGRDAPFEWLAFLDNLLAPEPLDVEITYTYSLGQDDRALRLDITLHNAFRGPLYVDMVEAAFIIGDGVQTFYQGPGFDARANAGRHAAWYGQGDGISYALQLEDGPLDVWLEYSNVAFGILKPLEVPGEGHVTVTRHLVVTAGGVADAQAVVRRLGSGDGVAGAGVVTGQVQAPAGALERGVRVHVLTEGGEHLSCGVADAQGAFSMELPAGSHVLVAKADGFDPSAPVPVAVSAGATVTAQLELPPSTPFTYVLRDQDGVPAPGRLTFIRQDGPPTNVLAAGFGEERHPGGHALVIHAGTGEGAGWVPFGTYRVVAGRGHQFEVDEETVVASGPPLALTFALPRAVDGTGWVSGDYHAHGEYSPDSSLSEDTRARTGLAEGLDFLVMTDHDTVRDYSGAIAAIPGAAERIKAVVASEVTTYAYGHFNAWPLTEKPGERDHGGIEWFGTTPAQLFARIRGSESHPVVIQVNHPRGPIISGYFSAVGYDRAAGTVSNPAWWSEDFDAVEVFNGGCWNGGGEPLQDWMDLLNRGYRFSVSGGSDSHTLGSILGIPRVYVPTSGDLAAFSPAELYDAFHGQRTYVSCGPMVEFHVDGKGLGEMVSGAGPHAVSVTVSAPSWMRFQDFRVLVNGREAARVPALDWLGGDAGIRHRGSLDLSAEADCWWALEVRGTTGDGVTTDQAPYAITNPIYVDVDGNGVFDAPLPKVRAAP
jgi:hypothetical protein